MKYKLCILAAGSGKRMRPLTDKINKALLPVDSKAAITHVIEKHSVDVEIIIAVNYKKDKVKEYLSCAHPERKITFVEIPEIDKKGSGPGFSLIYCKKYLDMPFIFSTIDTLFYEECPKPDINWMGISNVKDPSSFCTIKLQENKANIQSLVDKRKDGTNMAFIGIAGIKDYNEFFSNLIKDQTLISGELQVSNGFKGLIKKGVVIKKFSWFDIGNIKGYYSAIKSFSSNKVEFDFSKKDEYIYFVNKKVVKYFSEKSIVKNRVKRAKLLRNLTPLISKKFNYFYSYQMLKGNVLYDQEDPIIVSKLLDWLKEELWMPKKLSNDEKMKFIKACKDFYYQKTINRLQKYYSRFKCTDQKSIINNIKVPRVSELLEHIDFDNLSQGSPSNFHGDLQFDNILLTNNEEFRLLDWRQDFSGLIEYGDMYYDLAKLNGGLYISYKKIKQNKFYIKSSNEKINLYLEKENFLLRSKQLFDKFILDNNYDLKKIEILTGIIFLNMSAMHHAPFSHYVYYLGKKHLGEWILNLKTT